MMERPAQITCSHGPNVYADVHGRHVTTQYVFLSTSTMGDHIGIRYRENYDDVTKAVTTFRHV